MSKNKKKGGAGGGGPVPQDEERINRLLQEYNQLSETDKGIFLQRAEVFFLQYRWRPVSPTPELRTTVNQLSRLANLINTMMRRASMRRLRVEDLAIVSEQKIRSILVHPTTQTIQKYCADIEKVLDGKKSGRVNDDYDPGAAVDTKKSETQKQSEQSAPDSEEAVSENTAASGTDSEGAAFEDTVPATADSEGAAPEDTATDSEGAATEPESAETDDNLMLDDLEATVPEDQENPKEQAGEQEPAGQQNVNQA